MSNSTLVAMCASTGHDLSICYKLVTSTYHGGNDCHHKSTILHKAHTLQQQELFCPCPVSVVCKCCWCSIRHAAQLQQHLSSGIYYWQNLRKVCKLHVSQLCIFMKAKNSWWVSACRYHQERSAHDGPGHMEVRASLQWPLTSTSAASLQAVKMAVSRSHYPNVAC